MQKRLTRALWLLLAPAPLLAATLAWGTTGRAPLEVAVAVFLGFSALWIVGGWVASRRMTRPLGALVATLEEVRTDKTALPSDSETERDDELGAIAREAALIAGQRNVAENSCADAKRRERSLLKAMTDTILRIDRKGLVIDCHVPEGRDPFASPVPVVGSPLTESMPGALATVCRQALALVFADGEAQHFTFKTGDGTERREFQIRLSRSDEDEVIAAVRDLTRDTATGPSQQYLDTILEATLDPILMVSRDGEIRDANAAARELLAIDDIDKKRVISEFLPEWSQDLVCDTAIPSAIQDGAWHGEAALIGADGSEIPVSLSAMPHRTEIGAAELVSLLARDRSERKRFDDHLLFLAEHDPLTSLFTRKRFVDELGREIARAARSGVGGAVVRIDLDDLKHVNDSFGYDAGDKLLLGIAQILGEQAREHVTARLDGDEFALLITDSQQSQTESLLERILESVRSHEIDTGSHPVGVTASAGIVFFPENGASVEELLARADQALEMAKQRGRNQFVVYQPNEEWQALVDSRLSGEKRIREALTHNRFVLYLQPILDLESDSIALYEVLLRMLGENNELIPPGSFLDTAERFGLVRSIDRWVVTESIRLIGAQRRLGHDLRLSVNLSGKSLGDFELTRLIEKELRDQDVAPQSLTFEITETTAVADAERAKIFAIALKQIGCRIALDDFGVGFSSFHKLKSLPVDYLKIDGSFIQNLSKSKVDQHLVRAIVEVARALRKRTVAEFVGDSETLQLIKQAGVDFGQGFHIGKPTPADALFSKAEAS